MARPRKYKIEENIGCKNSSCGSFNKPGTLTRLNESSGENQYFYCSSCKKRLSSTKLNLWKERRKYTPEKIGEVLTSLPKCKSLSSCAKHHGVSRGAIRNWLNQLRCQHPDKNDTPITKDILTREFKVPIKDVDAVYKHILKWTNANKSVSTTKPTSLEDHFADGSNILINLI